MSAKSLPADPGVLSTHSTCTVSLHPLLGQGQAALAPDLASGVVHMWLLEVVQVWHNSYNEVVIRRADDLFACAAREGKYYDLIPKGAELVQATVLVQFAESAKPHAFQIVPPDTLKFYPPEDAPRLLPLLTRRGFSTPHDIAPASPKAGS